MQFKQISKLLTERAEEVAETLYPNGDKNNNNNYWEVGNIQGDKGKSLKIGIAGEKKGRYCDYANEEFNGDLLDLWLDKEEAKGNRQKTARTLMEIKQFLGIEDDYSGINQFPVKGKEFSVPTIQKEELIELNEDNVVFEYLTNKRKIPLETLEAFKIGSRKKQGNIEILYPFYEPSFSPDDEDSDLALSLIKYQGIDNKLQKNGSPYSSSKSKPVLFGWQALPYDCKTLIITEGEIDTLTLHACGIASLSLPFGGGTGQKHNWLEHEWERLSLFDKIILWTDNDETGEKTIIELVDRIPTARIYRVVIPDEWKKVEKCDVNDMWRSNMDEKAIRSLVNNAKQVTLDGLRDASDFTGDVIDFLSRAGTDDEPGIRIPLMKDFIMRPEETIIMTGINGHGKSQMVSQIMCEARAAGEKFCVFSGELKAHRLLGWLFRQAAASENPNVEHMEAIGAWLANNAWVIDQARGMKEEYIMNLFNYARTRFNVKFFIIDSFMKCGLDEDDLTQQKLFMERLCDWNREFGTTTLIIMHPRKAPDESKQPGKNDVRGSGSLIDQADSILYVWRNKEKERQIEELENEGLDRHIDKPRFEEVLKKPDAIFGTHKQRNGGSEPHVPLSFSRECGGQYANFDSKNPTSFNAKVYVPDPNIDYVEHNGEYSYIDHDENSTLDDKDIIPLLGSDEFNDDPMDLDSSFF